MSTTTKRKIETIGGELGKQFMIDQTHGVVRMPASEPGKDGMVRRALICSILVDESSLHYEQKSWLVVQRSQYV